MGCSGCRTNRCFALVRLALHGTIPRFSPPTINRDVPRRFMSLRGSAELSAPLFFFHFDCRFFFSPQTVIAGSVSFPFFFFFWSYGPKLMLIHEYFITPSCFVLLVRALVWCGYIKLEMNMVAGVISCWVYMTLFPTKCFYHSEFKLIH